MLDVREDRFFPSRRERKEMMRNQYIKIYLPTKAHLDFIALVQY